MEPKNAEPSDEPVDVEALLADIQRRVAQKRAKGLYSVDALAAGALDDTSPTSPEALERLRELAVQQLDFGFAASTKPVVGPIIGQLKTRLLRAISQPLVAMSAQATEFNTGLLRYVNRVGREVGSASATAAANATQYGEIVTLLADASSRLDDAESAITALRGQGLHERVARLERNDPGGPPVEVLVSETGQPLSAGNLGVMLEARDFSQDDADRWHALFADVSGAVLHVGSGSGRALDMLGEHARGVEDDVGLAAAGQAEGRPIVAADPTAHIGAMEAGSVEAALVTGLVERQDARALGGLVVALKRALAPGGLLVIEALDPEDADVLQTEAWRDPRRVRLLHADAIVALLEAAGFELEGADKLAGRIARYQVRGRA